MKRRDVLALVPAWLLVASEARAGSYLDRAAILLDECRRANEWLLSHLTDKELANVLHDEAEARLKAARRMQVPKEIVAAHPHLLLCLENAERASASASDGDTDGFLRFLRQCRDEEGLFKALLTQLKLSLPSVKLSPSVASPRAPSPQLLPGLWGEPPFSCRGRRALRENDHEQYDRVEGRLHGPGDPV